MFFEFVNTFLYPLVPKNTACFQKRFYFTGLKLERDLKIFNKKNKSLWGM